MSVRKIIIDAINEEETRVAVVSNDELEEYDFEVSNKEEVKGNIYLAKVTRVESSLQAVFVEYSRNRQGFLPFNEIHIDYFNLSNEIKEKLKQEYNDLKLKKKRSKDNIYKKELSNSDSSIDLSDSTVRTTITEKSENAPKIVENISEELTTKSNTDYLEENINSIIQQSNSNDYFMNFTKNATQNKNELQKSVDNTNNIPEELTATNSSATPTADNINCNVNKDFKEDILSTDKEDKLSKEYLDYGTRFGYKIQDVIHKNQLILVQVVKDERGNKGASLTTYLSIPGRYCVFMPKNFNIEGGISKKIVDVKERNRLKNILNNLDINNEGKEGSLIIRTAGVNKPEADIKQDYRYILNIWDNIKATAEKSDDPILIYEEASLIKKVLRDAQFDEVYVNNKNTLYNMIEFVKLISPEMVKKLKLFQGKRETIFSHFNIEEQVKSIYSPIVFLKSGGYLVIHPTEALTAIDINSGKFKGNKNVEETALKNNLEAAKEIAKQIKLRNLGGLIVIDFIDMENPKNRAAVEKKLKDEVKNDKAKIQIGQISSFGLLEMARQHVKSSLFEKNFIVCPKCQGMGYLKPLELNALQILRDIKSDLSNMNISSKQLKIKLPTSEAFFILNNKRHTLNNLEEYFDISLSIECDDNLIYPFYEIKEFSENHKNKGNTVLLLETEIANNLKNIKNNKTVRNSNKNNRTKNTKSKESYTNRKYFHNNTKNKTAIAITDTTQKKSWFKRLLKL